MTALVDTLAEGLYANRRATLKRRGSQEHSIPWEEIGEEEQNFYRGQAMVAIYVLHPERVNEKCLPDILDEVGYGDSSYVAATVALALSRANLALDQASAEEDRKAHAARTTEDARKHGGTSEAIRSFKRRLGQMVREFSEGPAHGSATKHWAQPEGGNAELIDAISKISDPVEMLECMTRNQDFVGNDPYYRDIEACIWEAVDRVVKGHTKAS